MKGIIVIPWIYLALLLVHSAKSQLGECQPGSGPYENRFCLATSMFPDWCNCDGRTNISLGTNGFLDKLKNTSIIYYFGNKAAIAIKCTTDKRKICLCPKNDQNERNCRRCDASRVSEMMCLSVDDNHLFATEAPPDGPSCNLSRLCQNYCMTRTCSGTPEAFVPPVAPRDSSTTTPSTQMTDPSGDGEIESLVLVGTGAGVFVLLVLVLLITVVICCRRRKDTSKKKKDGPYEVVYSTIDDGSLKNGNVIKPPNMFPNELYDARVEGQRPPIPPSRPGMAPHYKSLPSLIAGDYFSSGTRDQHQPYLPHHQPVWTNGPTLHRYPSSDMITPGYVPYVQNQQAAPGAPYMYLKKKPKQQYQSLSPSAELRPDEMENFKRLAAKAKPGYMSLTSDNNTWNNDGNPPLNRDPRSLPTEGTPKEYDEPRQHATYGYEKKGQKPRSASEKSSYKPIPAKRGVYRSVGSSNSGRDVSSDSEDESYQAGGSESSPYYFKVSHSSRKGQGEEGAIPDQTDQKTRAPADKGVTEQKEDNSRRKPKPRSRRRRKRPTIEVTCAMTENPLAAHSTDETDEAGSSGQCTDEDIDEGLQQIDSSGAEKRDVDDGFGDSDYTPLER